MPDPNNPDPLNRYTAPAIAALAIPLVLLGRHHATTWAAIAALAAIALLVPCVTWLEGKKRTTAGTIGAVLGVYTCVILWPWAGYWIAPPALLAIWTTYAIGRTQRKTAANAKALVNRGLAMVNEGMQMAMRAEYGEGHVRLSGKPKVGRNGTAVTIPGHINTRTEAGKPISVGAGAHDGIAGRLANRLAMPRRDLTVVDLSDTKAAGAFEIALPIHQPFDCPAPPKPKATLDGIPIGWDQYGRPLWIDNRLHGMVAGETGAGKSNTLNVILEAAHQRGDLLILIDPKETELAPWAPHALIYADTPDAMLTALRQTSELARARRQGLKAKGRKNWTAKDGPFYTVVIDEMSELCDLVPQAKALTSSLARLTRSAGFQIWFADQYPTAETFPKSVKQNTPNIIGHRVKNGTAVRVLLNETATADGWDLADSKLPAGRAVLGVQGNGYQWCQVFPEGEVPPAPLPPSTPVVPAPTGHTPYAGPSVPERPESPDRIPVDRNGPESPDAWALLTQQQAQLSTRERIVGVLDADPKGLAFLCALTGKSDSTVSEHMARMVADGVARKVQGGWIAAQ